MNNRQAVRTILIIFSLFLSITVHAEEIRDFNGDLHTLTEYTGKDKWTVVMLWHSECRISNAVVHEYVDFHMVHSDKNSTVLGVSLDGYYNVKDAQGFIDKHDIEFANLIGEYDEMAEMVENLTGGPWGGTPTFLIYSPEGELRAAQSGKVPAKIIEDFIEKNSL